MPELRRPRLRPGCTKQNSYEHWLHTNLNCSSRNLQVRLDCIAICFVRKACVVQFKLPVFAYEDKLFLVW